MARTAPHQVIVQARKPDFFSHSGSLYQVVTPDGLMRPVHLAERGGLYCGGRCARAEHLRVERYWAQAAGHTKRTAHAHV